MGMASVEPSRHLYEWVGCDISAEKLDIAVLAPSYYDYIKHHVVSLSDYSGAERLIRIENHMRWIFNDLPFIKAAAVEVPFFSQNVNTAKMLHELAAAAAIGIGNGVAEARKWGIGVSGPDLPDLRIDFVGGSTWKSKLGIKVPRKSSGIDGKQLVKEYVHRAHPNFKEIPDWTKTISRGPRKGHVEHYVNDAYDAIALADYAKVTHAA